MSQDASTETTISGVESGGGTSFDWGACIDENGQGIFAIDKAAISRIAGNSVWLKFPLPSPGTIVMVSTPKGSNWFRDTWSKGRDRIVPSYPGGTYSVDIEWVIHHEWSKGLKELVTMLESDENPPHLERVSANGNPISKCEECKRIMRLRRRYRLEINKSI
jgi:hypothetical protein